MVAVLLLGRPASHVPDYISYYLLASVPYLTACWLLKRAARRPLSERTLPWIWAAALLFRLTVLPLAPSLSEDTARYRWQGVVQAAGGDPYLAIPEDSRWERLRDSTWTRVSTKDKPSAYGPVLEQLNLWYYRLVRQLDPDPWTQIWLFKLPFALADLGVGLALMSLLAGLRLSRCWVLVYLWSPLAVTEYWIEGHNDAVGVMLVVAALALSVRRRRVPALVLLALATLCKFWPVVLAPFLMLARRDGRWQFEWRGLLASVAVGIVTCLPYWDTLSSVRSVLGGLIGGWRNNDSLFALLLRLTGGDMEMAAALAVALLLVTIGVLRYARLPPVGGELAAICALLLISANCFPWYLTWMLPLLAVHPVPALLLWTASVSLAYHVVPLYEATGAWRYDNALTWLQYVPVLTWLAVRAALASGRPLRAIGAKFASG